MVAGTVSTASITIARCSAGANSRLPPASNARRSATGAPGEIAMSTMPTATGPFNPNALSARTASAGTGTTTAKTTAASTTRRSSAALICSRPSINPIANMTANTVSVANRPIHWKGMSIERFGLCGPGSDGAGQPNSRHVARSPRRTGRRGCES